MKYAKEVVTCFDRRVQSIIHHFSFQLLTNIWKRMPGLFDSSIHVTPINRTSETLLWGRKTLLFVIGCGGSYSGRSTISPPFTCIKVWLSSFIPFFTDVSIQVSKGLRMIATLAVLGCFSCNLGKGRTTAVTVLTWEWVPLITRLWGSSVEKR